MSKNDLKTKKTTKSPLAFIKALEPNERKEDALELLTLMKEATGLKPVMWGESIVGFGSYHYKGASGREGDWPLTGFSPRKQNLTVYIIPGFKDYADLLKKLGPHKTSVSCLYITNFSAIHKPTLKTIIRKSVAYMKKHYPVTS